MKVVENIIGGIFLVIGVIMLIATCIVYGEMIQQKQGMVKETAIITEITEDNQIYVEYFVEGQVYNERIPIFSSGMKEGDMIEIYYDKEKPSEMQVKEEWVVFIALPILGIVFSATGGGIVFSRLYKAKLRRRLMKTGERVEAELEEIVLNRNYSVNGRHPYYIYCRWVNPNTGEEYLLKSDRIWYNPQLKIEEKNIQTLPVYMDPNNRKKYIVSLEEIEENVIDLR